MIEVQAKLMNGNMLSSSNPIVCLSSQASKSA